jgi:hypothetical protein
VYRLSHTLIAWVLLIQSIALFADNGDLTFAWVRHPSLPMPKAFVAEGIILEPWTPVATFVRQDTCLDEVARRTAEGAQLKALLDGVGIGMRITYQYRCAEE